MTFAELHVKWSAILTDRLGPVILLVFLINHRDRIAMFFEKQVNLLWFAKKNQIHHYIDVEV